MSKRGNPTAEEGLGVSKHVKIEEGTNGIKAEAKEGAAARPTDQKTLKDIRRTCVKYRDGEPLALPELYESSTSDPKMVEAIIPSEFLTMNTRRVKTRQIWGDHIYTWDSDVIAVLMHLGYIPHTLAHPPAQVHELHVLLRLLPVQDKYESKARFLKSRSWACRIQGCSFQVDACWMVTRGGASVDLHPSVDEVPAPYPTVVSNAHAQHHTRSTGRKVGGEVTVQFNLCNEPWLKYSLPAIADRGIKCSQWTSSRLLNEVLMMETNHVRYQIARTGTAEAPKAEAVNGHGHAERGQVQDVYCLSRCKAALPLEAMRSVGLPLPAERVEVLEEGLGWEELQWGVHALHVRGRELALKRIHWVPVGKARGGAEQAAKARGMES